MLMLIVDQSAKNRFLELILLFILPKLKHLELNDKIDPSMIFWNHWFFKFWYSLMCDPLYNQII